MLSEKRILQEAEALLPEIVRIRRHIHQYPELSYAEHRTAEFISEILTAEGIEHIRNVAGTGIIGIIRGEAAGKGLTAGLRADMDALPVTEQEEPEYRSQNEGVMHACGHDAHIAMLLGAAKILSNRRGDFAGKALLVFQPGEEKAPGGAKLITRSGILDQYQPDLFIAQHVAPELESGTTGFCAGPAMASSDEIYITVTGRGGHAARPTEYTDQIRIASELVIALNDPRLTSGAAALCGVLLGEDRVKAIEPRMGSEDFSFFAEHYPSLLYRLGVTRKGDIIKHLHTPSFNLDEKAMAIGAATMAWLALNLISMPQG